jgi:hypothetical protein
MPITWQVTSGRPASIHYRSRGASSTRPRTGEHASRLRRGHGCVRACRGFGLRTRHRRRRLAGDGRGDEAKGRRTGSNERRVRAGRLPELAASRAFADFVYTRNALHHLPDFWKGIALTRMAAVLVPGGTLRLRDLLFSFDLPEADARIAQWLDTAAAESSDAGWTRDELETHLRNEYSNVQLATRTVDPSGGLRNRGRRLRNSWSPRRLHLREISSGAATLGRRSPPSDRVSSAGGVVPFLRVLSL